MASGRIDLGGIAAVAACLALAVTGCGGGSSSAPGTAGGSSTASPGTTTPTGNVDGAAAASKRSGEEGSAQEGMSGKEGKSGNAQDNGKGEHEKKHPPLELPTGKPESGPTKAQQSLVPTADIKVSVPDGLATANTCAGKNLSPAISWRNVPAGTVELAIFAVNIKPVDGKLYFDWALAGVDPSLSGLKAGEVPEDAVLGDNSAGRNGYSLCPTGSNSETYIFSVYALPDGLSPRQGFDPLTLRKEATRVSHEIGLASASFGG